MLFLYIINLSHCMVKSYGKFSVCQVLRVALDYTNATSLILL